MPTKSTMDPVDRLLERRPTRTETRSRRVWDDAGTGLITLLAFAVLAATTPAERLG